MADSTPWVDFQKVGSSILLEMLGATVAEQALLSYGDAPHDELKTVQRKIDRLNEEILRRMSW